MKTARLLSLLPLLVLGLAFTHPMQSGKNPVIELSPAAFQQQMRKEKGMLIDVRTPGEYSKGHLAGAKLMNLFSDDFEAMISRLDTSKTYYVYCAAGGRSAECAQLMQRKGFHKVYDMAGGFKRWQAEGLPVEK